MLRRYLGVNTLALLTVLLFIAGITVACGGSDSDKTPTTSARSQSTVLTASPTVRTGLSGATATAGMTTTPSAHATATTHSASSTATKPSQGGTGSPVAGATTVKVTESEMKIELATTTAKEGTVTFEITNNGTIEHNLATMIAGDEHVSPNVAPGDTITWSIDFPRTGQYEVYCAVPGHKAAGMVATLSIT
jgi:uncharacterized cupredoxin-like copper-binding protein